MTPARPTPQPRAGVYRFPSRAPLPAALEAGNARVIRIATGNVRDKPAFLKETALALQFPAHFGQNWDAFYDCLTDLAEQAAKPLVIVFEDLSGFARVEPEEFGAAVDALTDAVEYWEEQGKRLIALVGVDETVLAPELPELSV
ncbi:MAG TPA: barstar family protein [Burkholderiales bacterium]|nr:barstar family protein [Burkholderiales bacterium]